MQEKYAKSYFEIKPFGINFKVPKKGEFWRQSTSEMDRKKKTDMTNVLGMPTKLQN